MRTYGNESEMGFRRDDTYQGTDLGICVHPNSGEGLDYVPAALTVQCYPFSTFLKLPLGYEKITYVYPTLGSFGVKGSRTWETWLRESGAQYLP